MKRLLSGALACLMALTFTACGSAKPAAERTSDFYGEALKPVTYEGNSITGIKDGELYRYYDAAPYEMDDVSKEYFAFEGVLAHLAEVGKLEIDSMEKSDIAYNAIKDKTELSEAEQTKLSNAAVLDFYSKKAGVTLTEAEIKTIGDAAVTDQEEKSKQRAKEMLAMELESAGFAKDDLKACAFSTSMMNIKAYCVAVFLPAEGKTDAVKKACDDYIAAKQKEFEQYLVDQYEVAKAAQVKVLKTGEVVLVMRDDAASAMTALEEALKK